MHLVQLVEDELKLDQTLEGAKWSWNQKLNENWSVHLPKENEGTGCIFSGSLS